MCTRACVYPMKYSYAGYIHEKIECLERVLCCALGPQVQLGARPRGWKGVEGRMGPSFLDSS